MTNIFDTASACLLIPGGLALGLAVCGLIVAIMFGVCDLSLKRCGGQHD